MVVTHIACGMELEWKTQPLTPTSDGNTPTQAALWCPYCKLFIPEIEASRPGPYVAIRECDS